MFKLAVISALFAAGASALQMVTPSSLVQCQPVKLTWNTGTGPFFVSALPGNNASGTAIKQWPETNEDTLTWMVDLPIGTNVSLQVTDYTGVNAWASSLVVQQGSSDSCLAGGSTATGTGAGSNATGTAGAADPSGTGAAKTSTTPTSGAGAIRVAGGVVVGGLIAALAL